MAFKEYRNMKVYEQSGYNYKATPTIMLKGSLESKRHFSRLFLSLIVEYQQATASEFKRQTSDKSILDTAKTLENKGF